MKRQRSETQSLKKEEENERSVKGGRNNRTNKNGTIKGRKGTH